MAATSDVACERPGLTSSTFLDRLKAGQGEAWRCLDRLYSPLVYAWCRRWGLSPQDAEDLTQEVFGAVVAHIASFRHDRPEDTFRGWLRTIAANKLKDFYRKRAGQASGQGGTDAQQRLAQVPDPLADDSGPDQQSADESFVARRALAAVRAEFEEPTWRAFWATAVEGKAAKDVAARLGLNVASVYQAKSRVLKRLRAELSECP